MMVRKQKFFNLAIAFSSGALLLIVSAVSGARTQDEPVSFEDIQRFSTTINQIKNYYVEPVDDEELFDNAIRGMLLGLDPHSDYLDEDDFDALQAATRGQFGGLGLEVTIENEVIKVIAPIDDTPAKKAGVQSGDYIVRLDGKPVKGMTLREAVKKMRGQRGTSVDVVIMRKGEAKPIKMTIMRDVVRVKSVTSRMLEESYGYVRISHFQALTTKHVLQSIYDLKKQAGGKLKGLVLDLRDNPGGLLDSAVQVSDVFIHNDQKAEEELIVYTEGRVPGAKYTAKASPGDILDDAPIVVLINQGSASGSEIVAGALRDNKRAILLGTKSFGKGSVQTVIPLDEHHGIKITTALYYTPSGDSIQAKGITPDIIVENLKVEQPANVNFMDIEESDLTGHLESGSAQSNEDKGSVNTKDLVYSDYQLHEALNVLKGLVLIKQ